MPILTFSLELVIFLPRLHFLKVAGKVMEVTIKSGIVIYLCYTCIRALTNSCTKFITVAYPLSFYPRRNTFQHLLHMIENKEMNK